MTKDTFIITSGEGNLRGSSEDNVVIARISSDEEAPELEIEITLPDSAHVKSELAHNEGFNLN